MSVDDTSLDTLNMRKHPDMVVHQENPLNLGAPPELVRRSFITPEVHFFVRNHGTLPQVNIYDYRLSVTGMVRSPLKLSLHELQSQFPPSTVIATLQCAGHRRSERAAIQPIPREIAWGPDAIGNALWRGVPLRDVLKVAGIEAGARHIAFTGLDEIDKGVEQ